MIGIAGGLEILEDREQKLVFCSSSEDLSCGVHLICSLNWYFVRLTQRIDSFCPLRLM